MSAELTEVVCPLCGARHTDTHLPVTVNGAVVTGGCWACWQRQHDGRGRGYILWLLSLPDPQTDRREGYAVPGGGETQQIRGGE